MLALYPSSKTQTLKFSLQLDSLYNPERKRNTLHYPRVHGFQLSLLAVLSLSWSVTGCRFAAVSLAIKTLMWEHLGSVVLTEAGWEQFLELQVM